MVNNVFAQIGLVMLIGLAAKNAILIVEFARLEYEKGKPLIEAALTGARIRLRPILMTSFAFILGTVPLGIATGAGAVSRRIIGTVVIGGMLAATCIAVCLIPVTFYVVEKSRRANGAKSQVQKAKTPPPGGVSQTEGTIMKARQLARILSWRWHYLRLARGLRRRSELQAPAHRFARGFRDDNTGHERSLHELAWWQVYQDETLQALIREAFTNNYDLRIAVARVEQARAVAMQARSQFVPSATYGGTVSRGRNDLFGSPFPNRRRHRQFRRGHAQRVLGSGSLGPRSPAQRIRARAISGLRRSAARRPSQPSERCRHGLFPIAGTGSGTGNRQPAPPIPLPKA